MKSLLIVPLLLLTACSGAGEDSLASDVPPASAITVEVDRGDGTPPETWSLDCTTPAESTHPDPEAACAALEALDDPFAPLPDDMVCTEIYGGPEQARVTGTWGGSPVDLTVSRRNGCEIAQWDSLVPLLPPPSQPSS
jgi:hypothetical protein